MRRNLKSVTNGFLMLMLLSHQACLDDLGSCVQRSGEEVTRAYDLPPFTGLEARDGLDIVLYQANEQSVLLSGPENVVSNIRLTVEDNLLIVQDENKCGWSRHDPGTELQVYHPGLEALYQNGYGEIYSKQTLQLGDLYLEARRGSGNISLSLRGGHIRVNSWRYGTITLRGEADRLSIQYQNNNAIFDARNLRVGDINMVHKSNNAFHLRPKGKLSGYLRARGNAYLYAQPSEIDVAVSGRGQIVPVYHDE